MAPTAQPQKYHTNLSAPTTRDDFARDVWCLLGIPVDAVGLSDAATMITGAIHKRERLSFVTPNVNWLVTALGDPEMRRMVIDADLSLVDGAPLVKMAQWLGMPMRERVAGSDLFDYMRDAKGGIAQEEGSRTSGHNLSRIFFFGGRDDAANAAHDNLNQDYAVGAVTAMHSAGWLNPGFGDVATMSSPEIIDEINAATPDFLIVALGAAKGQQWIDHNLPSLNAPVIAHLGAVVDFTAGTVVRAPQWMAKSGLEWLWRIIADGALWKRYAKDAISLGKVIIGSLIPQLMSKPKSAATSVAIDSRAVVSPGDDGTRIQLAGSLVVGPGLEPVRTAFREASAYGNNVILDFADVGVIDQAFLGLVLMLEKHLTRAGKNIFLRKISPSHLKLIRHNAMAYELHS